MTIPPEFAFLYSYDLEDREDEIDIIFNHPPTFDPKSLKIELSEDKLNFSVTLPDQIPIISGRLTEAVTSMTTNTSQNKFIITLEKSEQNKWPLLIKDVHETTKQIDPQSAFNLFALNHETQEPEAHQMCQKMINIAIDAHFLPAILIGIKINQEQGGDQEALMQFLHIAAFEYEHPMSCFILGQMLVSNKQFAMDGFNLLLKAAQLGVGLAVSVLGTLLSPLSDVDFQVKNAKQALEWFEQVIAVTDEPIALYEAAKLYDAGLGCIRNHEKALDYAKRAKKLNPNLPDLPTPNTSKHYLKTVGICSIVGIAAGAIGYGIYKIIKNRAED